LASIIREHAGAGLVALGATASAFAIGLFEPTGYAAASIVIWAAVIAGLIGRVYPAARVGRPAAAAGLCLAATAVLSIASVSWASDQGRAFDEAVRVSFYLGLFSLAVCTAGRAGRTQWLAGFTLGLTAVSALAVLAFLQPGLLGSQQHDVLNAAGRLSYPIGYWNGAAALMAAAAVLLAWATMRAPTRAMRSAAAGLIPIAGFGIWLASSRGGTAAVAVGLCVLVAFSSHRTEQVVRLAVPVAGTAILVLVGGELDHLRSAVVDSSRRADGDVMSLISIGVSLATAGIAWFLDDVRPRLALSRRSAVWVAAVGVVALVAVVVAIDPVSKFEDFKRPPSTTAGLAGGLSEASSHGRWQFWGVAVNAFEGAPIEGLGAGGYEDYWAQQATVPLFVRNPHSLPLQQAAELGIPGIALFIGFVGAAGIAIRSRLATGRDGDVGILAAVLAAGAVGACIDWTWEIPATFGPAVVCAGLLTASAPSKLVSRHAYWLGIGAVAVAWVAMVAGGIVVLTQLELRQSREAAAANNIGDAIDRARAAKTVAPWSAEPYTQLALLEEQQGNLDRAIVYLQQAEQHDSEDWRLAVIEARLQKERGDRRAAGIAIDRANRLSPVQPVL
jgi:hypothetical protein